MMDSPALKRGPDFVIIGAMKSMTSTLHRQLVAQPGIHMSVPKEPYYFSNDEVYARGPDWYASLFAACGPADICGESSTHYTKLPTYPQTVARLYDACPDVKLVYAMRHPIDRLRSQYVHEWTQRVVNEPIDIAIDTFPELVDYSRYSYQLAPYLATFGPRQVLPVFFDRLVAAPQAQLERICRFIGYGGHPAWQKDAQAENVSAERMRTSRWRDRLTFAPGVSWVRRTLVPQSVRDRIKQFWQMKKKPVLSPDRLQRLKEVFDKDLDRLGDWLGVRLSCDVFREATAARDFDWRDGLEDEFLARDEAHEVARQ